ncbi:Glutaredoxin [Artemisia annua]|uniref:Glutaredoxin n=1 Tax=Artemisia annua TaxID=35608 RepID=A0A2U1PLH6_ARTAN|nr:Glutaredoxin [Artemisia annua]
MIRLNRLATTLRTLSTIVRTTPSLATTPRHSLIQTASFKVKLSYNNNSWSTQSIWTSTGRFNFIGPGFDGKDPFKYDDDDKKLVECDNRKYVPNDVVLYQLEGCPLSNKVKVLLEYYGIPHKIMEVNPFYEWEIKRSDFRKVPVLMVDGEKLVNASEIIDEMFKRIHPDSAPVDVVTQKWHRWVDTVLLHVLLMNTYGSLSGALETYDYIWSYVFLEYYGIPHKIMEVNPFYEWEIKQSDFRKVPVLMVDGEKLVNASEIIDEMFKRIHPDSAPVDVVTQKWRRWVDTVLLPVLLMNTYGSLSGALETYDYIWSYGCYDDAQRFSLKHCGAFYSYYQIKKLKIRYYFWLIQKRKALNITDDRGFLYKAAEEWVDALKGRQYLGGTEPNLGDLAVFGILRPMRNLKLGKDLVENTHIGEWFTRMEKEMKPGCVKSCTLFIS